MSNREVTLAGTVSRREDKRRAEDIAEAVSGVTHVQNNLRVQGQGSTSLGGGSGLGTSGMSGSSGTGGADASGSAGTTTRTDPSEARQGIGEAITAMGSSDALPISTGPAGQSTSEVEVTRPESASTKKA